MYKKIIFCILIVNILTFHVTAQTRIHDKKIINLTAKPERKKYIKIR